ncbi:unnamed protein product [Brachionus calyciflorus]|uniref:Uncharacterized protein n=1 Tax=Brachionus calyciflorus TaxID=104777 RepID=A0A814AP45_9BILA|nr:unnamed protein product [Brachionus calyciflorus]
MYYYEEKLKYIKSANEIITGRENERVQALQNQLEQLQNDNSRILNERDKALKEFASMRKLVESFEKKAETSTIEKLQNENLANSLRKEKNKLKSALKLQMAKEISDHSDDGE